MTLTFWYKIFRKAWIGIFMQLQSVEYLNTSRRNNVYRNAQVYIRNLWELEILIAQLTTASTSVAEVVNRIINFFVLRLWWIAMATYPWAYHLFILGLQKN